MTASASVRRPGPSLVMSLLVMAVGLIVIVPSIVKAVSPFVDTFSTSTHISTEVVRVHLRQGDYRVYELTGTSSGFGNTQFRRVRPVSISPDEVNITDTAGRPVTTDSVGTSETITRGNRIFTAAVAFHIDDTDDYNVAIEDRALPVEFMVSRSLGDTFRSSAPWIGTGVLGALVLVLGIILLIVGLVRRNRANRAFAAPQPAFAGAPPGYATATWPPRPQAPAPGADAGVGGRAGVGAGVGVGAPAADAGVGAGTPAAGAPPIPGWYGDPADPQRLRYWDGNRWTEHTH